MVNYGGCAYQAARVNDNQPSAYTRQDSSPHSNSNGLTHVNAYDVVDFADLPGVECPCGVARRAFAEIEDFPGTVHVTDISADSRLHYHKRLTETYFFLECEADAKMQLDDEIIEVRPGMCVLVRPGVRHRAVGKMRVLILVLPKFDPQAEWFDDDGIA